nr:hypothetical protein [Armatimonas sp.]
MGRVISSIRWALAHSCPLRNPKDWHGGKVVNAAYHSDQLRRKAEPSWVYEEVYFGSESLENDGKRWQYPAWGFSLDRRYPKQGGRKGLQMLCGDCPACSTKEPAGCIGSFMDRDHDEFCRFAEEPDPFDLLVEKLGLRTELALHFPVTNPLWYGLWINPVIPREGVPLLRQLFAVMEGKDKHEEFFGIPGFLRALETAEKHGLELHVERWPNGSLGGSSPHCTRCKANMPMGTDLTCEVCGHVCSPKPGKWHFRRSRRAHGKALLGELGEERFIELVRWKLREQDASEEILETLIVAIVERERTRPVWEAEQKQSLKAMVARRRSEERFCKQVLFKGIRSPKRDVGQFRAPQFRQVLERCQKLGITVTRMSHSDSDYNMDSYRQTYGGVPQPVEQLDTWQAEGLNDWFGAEFVIPAALLETVDQPGTGFAARSATQTPVSNQRHL